MPDPLSPLLAPRPATPQVRIGNYKGEEVHVPFSSLLPMVHPNDFVLGGWDISGEAGWRQRARRRCIAHARRARCSRLASLPTAGPSARITFVL